MADRDQIKNILAEVQAAVDAAAKAAAEAKRREALEANPDLAEELQKYFVGGQTDDLAATVTIGKPESDTTRSLHDLVASGQLSNDELQLIAAARQQAKGASGNLAIPTMPGEIPGYELLEEIARGGMGVVYRARQ